MLTPRTTRTANFNPRSREGSDMPLCFCSLLLQHFNPRSREGSDIQGNRHEPSLHYFNPRSREGSDCDGFYAMNTGMLFQSTLPRRERRILACVRHMDKLFQSTLPRRERHGTLMKRVTADRLFQSTLPRRERQNAAPIACLANVFQSTLPRRERPYDSGAVGCGLIISIHAPAKGATATASMP